MKNILLWTFVVTICLLAEAQANCQHGSKSLTVGTHYIDCLKVECHPDDHVTALACPLYMCAPGKQIGYRERDLSKPYPACCEGPICKD